MHAFTTFVFSPAGLADVSIAIAASRAGAVGVWNAEFSPDDGRFVRELARLAQHARGAWGVCTDRWSPVREAALLQHPPAWLVLTGPAVEAAGPAIAQLRRSGTRVMAELARPPADLKDWLGGAEGSLDGLVVKGNEAGGFVGEDASFILLQKWLGATTLPLVLRGGLTPHVAAACAAVGVAGGVLESQLLLLDEVRLPAVLQQLIANLSGSETVGVGDGERGEYLRLLLRPSLKAARQFVADHDGADAATLRAAIDGRTAWHDPAAALLPIGQEVAFAAPWKKRHGTLQGVLAAFDAALQGHAAALRDRLPLAEGAPLARALGLRLPIVQGPMTRVSDVAGFALAVAEGGALPMLAFAMLKGAALEALLVESAAKLQGRPWGIGLLGFAPQELLDEQLAIALRFQPSYAIIAGGRPDQAVQLERAGIPSFLHLPAASLVPNFLQEGARRFIFEGRECGGHIGPLSSFVLWSAMVDKLLDELGPGKVPASEVELLFAGGVHDARSAAMLQVLVAPLVAAGAKVGVLMGSAYLFTEEIVETGAIVPQFQQEVLDCTHTVNLESGPGHASRCGYTPFAKDFFETRRQHRRDGVPPDESRRLLDDLILGRLRIASKGTKREGLNGALQSLSPEAQRAEGMYMLGQVATLRDRTTRIAALHAEVTEGAAALLADRLLPEARPLPRRAAQPADVAIVGVAAIVAQANDARSFWENIVAKVDAITEIPSHRWDWRLYFDADRNAPDKVYSKWGGFLDDLPFDPTRFGMPPKSIQSVDPMQLMGLEVARRTLADAGYETRPFDRERASVILGASGGAGDFGMQYGLRSELPRFAGALPAEVAARLPEWTEDSFAGILPNVAAGRIANRLNFGGMNLTADAACASSLAAVYQGVVELAAGRSDLVIAGGIDTVQGPFGYLCFSKTQALSPRGRCHTFDANGDGIVISEGIAMVAMKRLADAERDGDRIYAVIKGVGASSDGSAKGMTAPLPAGQLRAMRRAYEMAGFGPASVGLFEAHGTGTVAGDTAELESTTTLMREEGAPARHAVIGSVKTNIGHTKATAGVAGLVKAALALHRRVLPPHRNVTTPNRVLADEGAPLYLLDEARPWLADPDRPRRAACSAFGFGGTNFHVVLEEHAGEYRDWLRPPSSDARSAELLLWQAADAPALAARLDALLPQLAAGGVALRDLAASLAPRFSAAHAGDELLAVVAKDPADLATKLKAAIGALLGEAKPLPPGVLRGRGGETAGPVAVLFPGQGSQYPGMGREAALHFPVVAETFEAADAALAPAFEARFGPAARLSAFVWPRGAYDEAQQAAARARLTSTDVAQPALGVVATACWRLLQGLGLDAAMFGGHSYGEFVALHAAGAIGFDDLMALSAARGRFIVDAAAASGAELGTMAAVAAERDAVEAAIADLDDVLVANHNAPKQSIVSGSTAGVAKATERLRAAGLEVTPIPVAAAFHSGLVKPAQQPLAELIARTPWQPLARPVYSNTTARPHAADVARVQQQMAEHLVHPVEFVEQVKAMHAAGARLFVEVGPKTVLTRLVGRILEGQPHRAIAIDDGSGLPGLLAGLAQLLFAGVPLDLSALFAGRDCRVGDPDAPATLRPPEPVSRHAWLLNGSGARRAGEPVRQIGVTLEQAAAAAAALQPAAAIAAPAQAPSPSPITPVRPAVAAAQAAGARTAVPAPPIPRRSRPMIEERRTAPGIADSPVMSEYFATMRQFLETQERVMAAYLGEPALASAAPPRALPPARPRPAIALPRAAELPPAAAVVNVPVAAPAAPVAPVVAPVAAPVVAPAPVVAAAPVAAPAPAPVAAPAAAAHAPAALSREKLLDLLLAIVEEKTGYPRDMVGLDQNLEADLGIDSIKRIEVVGALLQQLPAAHRDALTEQRSKLNTQATLNGMLDLVMAAAPAAAAQGAVAVPFDRAGVGSPAAAPAADHPPRLVMRPRAEPLAPSMARRLADGRFVLTRDAAGVAEALAAALQARGRPVQVLDLAPLADEAAVLAAAATLGEAPIAGLLHLGALGTAPLPLDAPTAWPTALWRGEQAFFVLLRALLPRLGEGAHVLAASDLGGLFGREGSAGSDLRLLGGGTGLLKSLREERADLRVKAVDVDPGRTPAQTAADLLAEIELDGGRLEVGYPGGTRTVFISAPEAITREAPRDAPLAGPGPLVVLATGGARGITAEVLRTLARPGAVLVLAGRSAWPADETVETAALADTAALRAHFVAAVREGRERLTPAQIGQRVQRLLAEREMRANRAALEAAGASVEYHALDTADADAVAALVADLRRRHGRIDGVVHGAGVIEDKRIADKTAESWARVVGTKVLGLLALVRALEVCEGATPPRFLSVFSSVAGRYGNSGQSDYATANELMNRLAAQLQARWGEACAVSALCWGPWGPTTTGAGMVTPETEAKFAAQGVTLVSAALGRQLFRDELARPAGTPVEVVCGQAAWDAREAAIGAVREVQTPSLGPLIGRVTPRALPTGERIVPLHLDPARHLYLQEHAIDGKMILPAAAALEILAEAARALWPGWQVAEVRELKLLKGVEVPAEGRALRVFLAPPPYGSSEGFDISAALQTELDGGKALNHYRATVRLEPMLQPGLAPAPQRHAERTLTPAQAYGEWLFHGPRFQVLERFDGLSQQGARAQARPTRAAEWLAGADAAGGDWVFDPALLDAVAQMNWLWARAFRDESALPARFGRVARHVATIEGPLTMHYRRQAVSDDATRVRGEAVFCDAAGQPVLSVEELDSIASPALNRLGGSARTAVEAPSPAAGATEGAAA